MPRTARRKRSRLLLSFVCLLLLLAIATAGYADHRPPDPSESEYLATLERVAVATVRADAYDRDEFGSGWKDPDSNGCDARNDMLARDLTELAFREGTNRCVVVTGRLDDPYTASTIHFVRGNETSTLVQIDHIVPLSWAWGYGAWSWSDEKRERFANDPRNLLAVDGPANASKSDSGPGEWMPPNDVYHCAYVKSFLTVVAAYSLSMPSRDKAAIRRELGQCAPLRD